MNIAVYSLCYRPTLNGVVVSIESFRKELERRGHCVHVFAPAYRGYHDENARVHRFPSFQLPRHPDYPFVKPFARTGVRLRDLDIDIVHSQHLMSLGEVAVKQARANDLPIVYTFHTLITEYTHYVPFFQGITRRVMLRQIRDYCSRVDHVIAPTSVVADLLREYGVKTPITPVPTGVTMPAIVVEKPGEIRRWLGVPGDLPLLVFVGRLSKEKNLDFLLRAFSRIRRQFDCGLLLVGPGPLEQDMRREAASGEMAGRLFVAGGVAHAEIGNYYAAGDIFVMPSVTETQGVVLVEAMACGLPCVAVEAWGPREIVQDGRSGHVVPLDEQVFADSVVSLMCDTARRGELKRGALLRAEEFTPAACTDRLLEVYGQVMGTGGG